MIVLTRYLYIRDDVLASLLLSILEKKRDEALFWAYEIYHSGFQQWVADFLYTVYRQNFWPMNPALNTRMLQWSNESITDITSVGNMVVNMASPARSFDIIYLLFKSMPTDITSTTPRTLVIQLNASQVAMYETIDHTKEIPGTILSKSCLYETRKNLTSFMNCLHAHLHINELFLLQTQFWLYYASFSPIWYARICAFRGIIDHETRTVDFKEEDDLQTFYGLYGYEPDEQSDETLAKICRLKESVQLSRSDLAGLFGCNVKTVIRRILSHSCQARV